MNNILLMVTYKGDVVDKLKDSRTPNPFRLNGNGDTEQAVEMTICKGGQGIPIKQLKELFVKMILADKDLVAKIIKHEWVTHFFD